MQHSPFVHHKSHATCPGKKTLILNCQLQCRRFGHSQSLLIQNKTFEADSDVGRAPDVLRGISWFF